MSNEIRALLVGFALLLTTPAVATESLGRNGGGGAPPDGNVEGARAIFQQGVELFHEGDFEAALAEFRKAYATAPSFRILYNIAQTYLEMHDYVNSLKYYQRFLADGGAEIPADRRAQVEEAKQKLEARIAHLDVTVNLDGAEVRIDDVVVGVSPLPGPIAVNPGPRRVSAVKTGSPAVAQTVIAAGTDRITVTLDLSESLLSGSRPRFVDVTRSAPRRSSASSTSRSSVPLIVSLAATGACAVATGILGWLALQAKSDFDRDLNTFRVPVGQMDSDRLRLRSYALATDVAAAATLVAAGFSVYFVLSRPSRAATQTEKPSPFVAVAPTLGGVAVHGGW